MLDKTVATLSPNQINSGLEKLILYERVIKTDDEPIYIPEELMSLFDYVTDSYKKLEHSHEIRRKHPSFKIYKTYSFVRGYFIRQQIEEASYTLIDMHKVYESISDESKPKIKQEKLDKFRDALHLFRKLVQSGKLEKRYGIALPRLEQEYKFMEEYAKPKETAPVAISSGV